MIPSEDTFFWEATVSDPSVPSNVPSEATLDSVVLRTFQFIRAVSINRGIRAAFAERGYNEETHQAAWASLQKAAGFHLGVGKGPEQSEAAAALVKIDAWDEPTFKVARAILAPFPAQQAFVFNNLEAQTGPASVLSVTQFLDRLDALESGEGRTKATRKDDQAAIAKLAARKINANERARMRGLLKIATGFEDPNAEKKAKSDDPRKKEIQEAKVAVYYYFTEWSEIARTDLTRRDYLIQLGLVKRKKGAGKGGNGGGEGPTGSGEGAGGAPGGGTPNK